MYKKRSKVIYNRTKMDQNWNKNETKSKLIKKRATHVQFITILFFVFNF